MLGRVDGLIIMAPDGVFSEVWRVSARVAHRPAEPGGRRAGVLRHRHRQLRRRAVRRRAPHLARTPPPRHDQRSSRQRRCRGTLARFPQALTEAGIDPGRRRSSRGLPGNPGHAAGQTLLARRPRPTAVFAANDSMAIGLISAARERASTFPATSRSSALTT